MAILETLIFKKFWGRGACPQNFLTLGSLKWPFHAIRVVFQHFLPAIYLLFVGITA